MKAKLMDKDLVGGALKISPEHSSVTIFHMENTDRL